jgi:hypothetical protein
MIISIHQPGYLPWAGFFKKIQSSDIFVFLIDAQYKKNDWQNRNKIRTSEGTIWLTVPIKSNFGTMLMDTKIDYTSDWIRKHKKSIENHYSKAKFFKKYWDDFESIYDSKFENLLDLNMKFIEKIMDILEINTKTMFSTELETHSTGSDRILEICENLNADTYISGKFGKEYLNLKDFEESSIKVKLQSFKISQYTQCYSPFTDTVSAIDLIFNEGPNSSIILKNSLN